MKIWKNLRTENIFLDVPLPDKKAALRFVADICTKNGIETDTDAIFKGLNQREQIMSTGIGNGIGFPHTITRETKDASVFLVRPAVPLEFKSLDNLPVDIVIALIIPEKHTALHLQMLAGVSRLCKNPDVLKAIRQAGDSKELWGKIRNLEEKMAFH